MFVCPCLLSCSAIGVFFGFMLIPLPLLGFRLRSSLCRRDSMSFKLLLQFSEPSSKQALRFFGLCVGILPEGNSVNMAVTALMVVLPLASSNEVLEVLEIICMSFNSSWKYRICWLTHLLF